MANLISFSYLTKTDWLLCHDKRFIHEANEHIQAIQQALHQAPQANQSTVRLLNSKGFWDALQISSGFSKSIEALAHAWQNHAAFVGLGVKDLLFLKDMHMVPLENILIQYQRVLEASPMKWPQARYQAQKQLVAEKLLQLQTLKQTLQAIMIDRCEVYQTLGQDRRCDDILLRMVRTLNGLALLAKPIPEPSPSPHLIDDDQRLGVYDWLLNSFPQKKAELEKIIAPLSAQTGYSPPLPKKEVLAECEAINKFCASIQKKLGKSIKKAKVSTLAFSMPKCLHVFFDFVPNLRLMKALSFVWRYAPYVALGVTLSVYLIFAPALLTGMSLAYGSWVAGVVGKIWFYGIALGPAWWIVGKQAGKLGGFITKTLGARKHQEMQEALILLQRNQRHIGSKLSVGILDIAYFDIDLLEKGALRALKSLEGIRKTLQTFRMWERWLLWGKYKVCQLAVDERLQHQKALMAKKLEMMAEHISLRVGDALIKFQRAAAKNQTLRVMPENQIGKLKAFVQKYGTQNVIKRFEQNSNILKHLATALERDTMIVPTEIGSRIGCGPWGGRTILSSSLCGWHHLLSGLLPSGTKQEAALAILTLLAGDTVLTPESFENHLRVLGQGYGEEYGEEDALNLQCVVQNYLFKTLSGRPPEVASLLTKCQKQQITDWVVNRQVEIDEAKRYFSSVFAGTSFSGLTKPVEDKTLARYFVLLEGADFAHYANGGIGQGGTQNLVKRYFHHYKGDNAQAVRFLRFVPDNKKSEYIKMIANRRIGWLLNHIKQLDTKTIFVETDIELFKNYRLLEPPTLFDFGNAIRQHHAFGGWQQNMANFLKTCREAGFDDGSLFREYMAKKPKPKQTNANYNTYHTKKLPFFSSMMLKTCGQAIEVESGYNMHSFGQAGVSPSVLCAVK